MAELVHFLEHSLVLAKFLKLLNEKKLAFRAASSSFWETSCCSVSLPCWSSYKQEMFVGGSASPSSGFLGKVFLHKLLSSCPNMKEKSIYVLVRGQKELSAEKRFEKDILEDSLLFRGLLARNPEVRSKLRVHDSLYTFNGTFQVVEGDIAKSKLGMSPDDYEEVRTMCTTIIHMAATTNFNENLRRSVQLNVHGVCILGSCLISCVFNSQILSLLEGSQPSCFLLVSRILILGSPEGFWI